MSEEMAVKAERKGKAWIWILTALLVVLAGAGAFGYNYYYNGKECGVNKVTAAVDEMELIAEEWNDALTVAGSTSRISLSGPVADLQEIKRETSRLEVPVCVEPARDKLVESMEESITALTSFMAQDDDEVVVRHMRNAEYRLIGFWRLIDEVLECAPFCD